MYSNDRVWKIKRFIRLVDENRSDFYPYDTKERKWNCLKATDVIPRLPIPDKIDNEPSTIDKIVQKYKICRVLLRVSRKTETWIDQHDQETKKQ